MTSLDRLDRTTACWQRRWLDGSDAIEMSTLEHWALNGGERWTAGATT
jgi:hypothetical protein